MLQINFLIDVTIILAVVYYISLNQHHQKMKPLITTVAILFLIIGCRKSDIHFIRGKLVKCDVAEQSPVWVGYEVGNGFKKTFYNDGLVKTVLTKVSFVFFDIDSIQYTFTYSNNKANVTVKKWFFSIGEDGMIHPDPSRPPLDEQFTVEFDPRTLNATKAGNTIFKYDRFGKLTGYDDFTIEYDTKGNIVVVNCEFNGSVVYEYDYTKTAKQQLYYTTGFMTNEMYNLMEIMGWIPVEPNNLRISHTVIPTGTIMGKFFFTGHVVNRDGILTSFHETFDEGGTDPSNTVITNTWNCQPVSNIIKRE